MNKDIISWASMYIEGFKYVAKLTHGQFKELDEKYDIMSFLFDYYEVGHTLDGRNTIEGIYNRIKHDTVATPFSEDAYLETGLF